MMFITIIFLGTYIHFIYRILDRCYVIEDDKNALIFNIPTQ